MAGVLRVTMAPRLLAFTILGSVATSRLLAGTTAADATAAPPQPGVVQQSVAVAPEPTVQPEADPVRHSTGWVNGVLFQCATKGPVEVWVSVAMEHDHVVVYVANASADELTFDPAAIRFSAPRRSGRWRDLETYSADEYVQRVRLGQYEGLSVGFSGGGPASARPDRTGAQGGPMAANLPPVKGFADSQAWAAAHRASQARLAGSLASFTSKLARANTIAPSTYYGGVVYYEKVLGERLRVSVPFGGIAFDFEFPSPPEP